MPNINQVLIAGNIVQKPELRFTPQGKALCEFTLAVNQAWGEAKETAWVRCVAWGGWAEAAGQLVKGDACLVNGRIKTESWESKKEAGKKESRTVVVAYQLYRLVKEAEPEGGPVRQPAQRELPVEDSPIDDPF